MHFHMLRLGGGYVENGSETLRFHRAIAPSVDELKALVHAVSHCVARFLEQRGCRERGVEELGAGHAHLQVEGKVVDIHSGNAMASFAERRRSSEAIVAEDLAGDAGPHIIEHIKRLAPL